MGPKGDHEGEIPIIALYKTSKRAKRGRSDNGGDTFPDSSFRETRKRERSEAGVGTEGDHGGEPFPDDSFLKLGKGSEAGPEWEPKGPTEGDQTMIAFNKTSFL